MNFWKIFSFQVILIKRCFFCCAHTKSEISGNEANREHKVRHPAYMVGNKNKRYVNVNGGRLRTPVQIGWGNKSNDRSLHVHGSSSSSSCSNSGSSPRPSFRVSSLSRIKVVIFLSQPRRKISSAFILATTTITTEDDMEVRGEVAFLGSCRCLVFPERNTSNWAHFTCKRALVYELDISAAKLFPLFRIETERSVFAM